MPTYNCNLNISYTLPGRTWDKLEVLYTQMPGWSGYQDGCALWQLEAGSIEASVEPSGLQLYACLPSAIWQEWLHAFQQKASVIVGYDVGEPEDGDAFPIEP